MINPWSATSHAQSHTHTRRRLGLVAALASTCFARNPVHLPVVIQHDVDRLTQPFGVLLHEHLGGIGVQGVV